MSTHENKQEISQEPVRVELGERSYDIRFYYDEPQKLAGELRTFIPERALVVSNDTIWKLHGERLMQALGQAGVEAGVALIGDGEKYKTLQSAEKLYDTLISGRFSRHSCLIAFGGGVVGDLTGFVAATFMRGIRFIQIPTTVVAMVDSSVGGKTAVDHPLGKNLIGAFYQPKLVAINLGYLKTLDSHNIRGGFGEIIKYGMILDRDFFDYLEQHLEAALALEPKALTHLVRRSCELKAQVVIQDEHESGLRAILNYGHTFAHAIESLGEYKERQFHGQAVAIGMVAAAELACQMGIFSRQEAQRQLRLLERAGLPTRIPGELKAADLLERMKGDKKASAGRLRFVLPLEIGRVEMREDVNPQMVIEVLEKLRG